ncbi:hypothetical protein AQ490_14435 [Wenjunlia vitaminophila]|uniref:Uncharacterized protein n=1 Tax=Wenjunlia vitaminophila TaxID=76728 RepID=A0A0T6LWD9_WENVI|nr:hypothetical protein [Wenjunlia vitaminophila]KRV50305.1 hypothetical protein AQ490_14435 [Wenjunlia vitaminophila]
MAELRFLIRDDGDEDHAPDFPVPPPGTAVLIDVRPADLVEAKDAVRFAVRGGSVSRWTPPRCRRRPGHMPFPCSGIAGWRWIRPSR